MMLARFLLVCVLVGFAAAQGVLNENLRWRVNGVRRMAYSFHPSYPQQARQSVLRAIERWNQVLGDCLPLQPRRAGDRDYINVFNGGGCFSMIGKVGGAQDLSLSVNGCVYRGTVIHEFLHAAGLIHTQKRPDRDNFITIHWGNIVESWKSQFTKESSRDIGKYTDYDIYSIMHYSYRHPSWSINNRPGFTAKIPNVDYRRIGTGDDFSQSDVLAIRKMYKCPARKFTAIVNNDHSNNRNGTQERKPILCSNV
ncbi:MAG: peptidase family M12A-domain-containing protein [Linnemannia elongata]|nr:MAG: peptidase family M12A-domain-containing protein [Linnemannia elongata]